MIDIHVHIVNKIYTQCIWSIWIKTSHIFFLRENYFMGHVSIKKIVNWKSMIQEELQIAYIATCTLVLKQRMVNLMHVYNCTLIKKGILFFSRVIILWSFSFYKCRWGNVFLLIVLGRPFIIVIIMHLLPYVINDINLYFFSFFHICSV